MQYNTIMKQVVILGGGFGGVKVARELIKSSDFHVTLISDQPTFRYYPALYRAATGRSHLEAVVPLTDIFQDDKLSIVRQTAVSIDRIKKHVLTADKKSHNYDVLIVALGVITNYFGIVGLDKFSYGIKSIEDAEAFKHHLHNELIKEQRPDLNYVVIGGGPTGIELVGALPNYLQHICELHHIKRPNLHIKLVEAAPQLLPRMPKSLSRAVEHRLRSLGVKLYLNEKVEAETIDELKINGQPIKSHSVVWTAGVTNNPFLAANKFTLDQRGRVEVNQYLQAEDNIYVIGDNAATQYSGLAQTAIHDACFVAKNLRRETAGRQPLTYKARQPVSIIPVGVGWAAVNWRKLVFNGRSGWWLRRAADLVAYHDIEPIGRAWKLWRADSLSEEECPVCNANKDSVQAQVNSYGN